MSRRKIVVSAGKLARNIPPADSSACDKLLIDYLVVCLHNERLESLSEVTSQHNILSIQPNQRFSKLNWKTDENPEQKYTPKAYSSQTCKHIHTTAATEQFSLECTKLNVECILRHTI
jgi:hypothetical protein